MGIIIIGLSIASCILSYGSKLFWACLSVGIVNLWTYIVKRTYRPDDGPMPMLVMVNAVTSFAVVGLFIGSFFV